MLVNHYVRLGETGHHILCLRRVHPLIVLIDDDDSKRDGLERLLHGTFPECKIATAKSCDEALGLVHTLKPKVIVTNGHIGNEDGIEFARYVVKEIKAPVVMISLRGDLRPKALAAGVAAFVETGDDDEVMAAIAQAIELVEKN